MKYFLILFFISFSVFSQSDSSYYGEKISSTDLQQLSNIDLNKVKKVDPRAQEIVLNEPLSPVENPREDFGWEDPELSEEDKVDPRWAKLLELKKKKESLKWQQ